jgi:hypothetical protein
MISPYEVSRQILPHILNRRGLTGLGVEVGVCEGYFSECILKTWAGEQLYCVDAWADLPGYEEQYDHEANYQKTLERLSPYEGKYTIVRKASKEASQDFEDQSLDFVYLDADHTYLGCLTDLESWYDKIRVGGLFAGDDYGAWAITAVDFGHGQHAFGVKKAVDEFACRIQKNISIDWTGQWLIPFEGQEWWARNWWFIK